MTDALIKKVHEAIQRLKELRAALVTQAVTGRSTYVGKRREPSWDRATALALGTRTVRPRARLPS